MPGGPAGLVLPDGTLFGEDVKNRIKEALLKECSLHTIVRLPKGVFNLYSGIRTNLIFFTKGAPTKEVALTMSSSLRLRTSLTRKPAA